MVKVIIHGCNGNMGQVLSKHLQQDNQCQIVAGIDRSPNKYKNDYPVYKDIFDFEGNADVIIDFSNPYYLPGLLDYSIENNMPLVIATTGFSPKDIKDIENAAKNIPIFYSSNMSLGINVLIELVTKAIPTLSDSFDIEIIEKHHNQKADAPSGTAYMIANKINEAFKNTMEYVFGRYSKKEKRRKNEIGIHAVRGGTIVGEHSVIFAGQDETIEIKHSAFSKSIFAIGAIKAAKYIVNQENGLYDMNNLVASNNNNK
ncbi:4-hydroxy-tetrahydrodipicolinate reductase [Caldisalinibacter kiritimatiensis]|uniref:4-hydroxy-tetrahydrodipicolinate reductase n=1 Tax=Caldisalinibacter kiritimatiensis TaxID=1304284 RepID=R1CQE4_9FIRM|nr:4-hydroxy-tetrahydrodipicolinate reductase [Caldisalinibacter kiritimatiensis]EOD00891.1 Dihydrodipicolinate reductase [Caldisalinibacter kiritimatiensis]